MDLSEMDELDGLIDGALRSEPMRDVPAGFQKRMGNRLQVTALVQQERQGFRFRVAASALAFAALGVTAVGVPAVAFFQGWMVRSVPGAMGYFDYLTVYAVQNWDRIVLGLGVAALIAVAVTALGVLLPHLHPRAQRQH